MQKIVDWEIAFDSFINTNKNKSFEWGTWDCCLFSNALIKDITGEDLIPKTLKWKDEESAMKSIKNNLTHTKKLVSVISNVLVSSFSRNVSHSTWVDRIV
jgi:hypothetical protein